MIQLVEPTKRFRTGVLLRLDGECGHNIEVLVGGEPGDAKSLLEARESEDHLARLTRFCPFCGQDRQFILPIPQEEATSPVLKTHSWPESRVEADPGGSARYNLSLQEIVSPSERAHRHWESGRMVLKKIGESTPEQTEKAVEDLRKAVDMFDWEGFIMPQLGAMEDLQHLLEALHRTEEASEIKKQIQDITGPTSMP